MSLVLLSNTLSIGTYKQMTVSGSGGIPPYTYSVLPGGAGGLINPSTGLYASPSTTGIDVLKVVDAALDAATLSINVISPLQLFCDIIQKELGLAQGRVYLWDQKIMQPTDSGLYVAVSIVSCKPFGNSNRQDGSGSGLDSIQSVNMLATLGLDIISRGPEARDRKEEVILALASNYAETQQELNGFYIAQISSSFTNLSEVDGAAIPYRFNISVNIQYAVTKVSAVEYYDTYSEETITDP